MRTKPTATPTPALGWYYQIQPNPPSGPTCLIGYWKGYTAAADLGGGLLYLHSFQCHLTGGSVCNAILGNGLAYPKDWPWVSIGNQRVPDAHRIPADAPVQLPIAGNPHQHGWYSLYYAPDGTCTVFPKKQAAKYQALVAAGQGVIPWYADTKCPGWPFFFVGSKPGEPDHVCN